MDGRSQANLMVFRDTRRSLRTRALLGELAEAVRRFVLDPPNRALALEGLSRAGE